MADVTFSGLPHELAVAPAAGDWLAIDDVDAGETKKMHPATMLASYSLTSHTHTLATGATDVTATYGEVNTTSDGAAAKNSHVHDMPYTLRTFRLNIIYDNGSQLGIQVEAGYNQVALVQEMISKGEDGTNFNLSASGEILTIKGITGVQALGAAGCWIESNNTGTVYYCSPGVTSEKLSIGFTDAAGSQWDMMTLASGKSLNIRFGVITVP